MIPITDTHQHLVMSNRFPYSWTDGIPQLKGKKFDSEDYAKEIEGTGIDKTIFMESTPDSPKWHDESELVLDMASQPNAIMQGAILNCRPEEDGFEKFLDQTDHSKRVGLRRILHIEDDALSQTSLFRKNIALLAERNLTFDMCFLSRQLPIALELAKACPNVRFILDHCGVPDIASDAIAPWKQDLKALSKSENVFCKISGVLAYCKPEAATLQSVQPYVEHSIECFGWDRIVWGGDWPVCTITSSLKEWVTISRALVAKEDPSNQQKLFNKNAQRIYNLDTV